MGNSKSITSRALLFENYRIINSIIPLNYSLWEHNDQTHSLMQFQVKFDSSYQEEKFASLLERSRKSDFLWKIQGFWKEYGKYVILTERVVCNLSQFKDIPWRDALYFLRQILGGIDDLYQQFGSFLPREQMFLISQKFQVKTWASEQFIQWAPHYNALSQKQIVFRCLAMIEQNTDHRGELINVCQQLLYQNIQTIKNARKSLEKIIVGENLQIPQRLESLNNFTRNNFIEIFKKSAYQVKNFKQPTDSERIPIINQHVSNYVSPEKKMKNILKNKRSRSNFDQKNIQISNISQKKIDHKRKYIRPVSADMRRMSHNTYLTLNPHNVHQQQVPNRTTYKPIKKSHPPRQMNNSFSHKFQNNSNDLSQTNYSTPSSNGNSQLKKGIHLNRPQSNVTFILNTQRIINFQKPRHSIKTHSNPNSHSALNFKPYQYATPTPMRQPFQKNRSSIRVMTIPPASLNKAASPNQQRERQKRQNNFLRQKTSIIINTQPSTNAYTKSPVQSNIKKVGVQNYRHSQFNNDFSFIKNQNKQNIFTDPKLYQYINKKITLDKESLKNQNISIFNQNTIKSLESKTDSPVTTHSHIPHFKSNNTSRQSIQSQVNDYQQLQTFKKKILSKYQSAKVQDLKNQKHRKQNSVIRQAEPDQQNELQQYFPRVSEFSLNCDPSKLKKSVTFKDDQSIVCRYNLQPSDRRYSPKIDPLLLDDLQKLRNK